MKHTIRTPHTLTMAALAALTLSAMPHATLAQTVPGMTPTTPDTAQNTPTEKPPITSSAYVLAPFDTLTITVQGHDDMAQSPQVLTDGTFNYPIIGTIKASGMTVAQLKAYIVKGLSTYYNDPDVTISVRESHIQRITVSGIAHAPGLYDYRPGIRLSEVVAQSGGSNNAQELTEITLVTKRNGEMVNIPIDIVALLAGDASQNVLLQPGDTILFSARNPEKAMVQIVGQVTKAGQYPVVKDGATVISLLTEAGGTTAYAALTKVQVIHNGKTTNYDLHPTLYNIDDPAGQIRVFAGDTINVPLNNSQVAIQGEVRTPSVYTIPDGEPLSVFKALSLAGGPTIDGDKKTIGIMRLNKANQRDLIEINLDDIYHGKNTKNVKTMQLPDMPLQDKDILIVPTRRHGHNPLDYIQAVPGYYYIGQLLGLRR